MIEEFKTTRKVMEKDELFQEAAELVVKHQSGSASLLQRKLKLGYNRAGKIMNQLYVYGIVGEYQDFKPREVMFKTTEELKEFLDKL